MCSVQPITECIRAHANLRLGLSRRPRCEVGELEAFNWHEHDARFSFGVLRRLAEDGRNYGVQSIVDQKLGHELRTTFVKEDERLQKALLCFALLSEDAATWHVRIETSPLEGR